MTPIEAVAILRRYKRFDAKKIDGKVEQAFELAVEALELMDKYKWHDIVKDPQDLPKDGMFIEAVDAEEGCIFSFIYHHTNERWLKLTKRKWRLVDIGEE